MLLDITRYYYLQSWSQDLV